MSCSTLPIQNCIVLLQEKCSKHKISLPSYHEDTDNLPGKVFKCICQLLQWRTEGLGCSKKIAKQNAAMEMLKMLETEDLTSKTESTGATKTKTAISMLYEYCSREKIEKNPLFADKPNEDDLFVVTCTWNDFTSEGRSSNKKSAKEMAADLCAQHFKIYKYFENIKMEEERQNTSKTPTQQLNELCQLKKKQYVFGEEKIVLPNNMEVFVVTCKVGELEAKSAQNILKKHAKIEATTLMLKLLNGETPASSPSSVSKSKKNLDSDSEYSDSDEPLAKRVK